MSVRADKVRVTLEMTCRASTSLNTVPSVPHLTNYTWPYVQSRTSLGFSWNVGSGLRVFMLYVLRAWGLVRVYCRGSAGEILGPSGLLPKQAASLLRSCFLLCSPLPLLMHGVF